MPRKPKQKIPITVLVSSKAIRVVMHAPTRTRKSWYAYWTGLRYSMSTGQSDYDEAVKALHGMIESWNAGQGGRRAAIADAVLSDEEFAAIQRAHFDRFHDLAEKKRAAKTLDDCLEAVGAFRDIIKMDPINFTRPVAAVTPDICAAFQRKALTLPRNWRKKYPNSKKDEEVTTIRANTIVKWSRVLQAAFQRANQNAGKKCVRGVVLAGKLLRENPWSQFTWIEGENRPIRQFDSEELLSLLKYFEVKWPGVSVGSLMAKVCLWSQCRRTEVTSLTWDQLRQVGSEHHFEIIGKWGVEKWFRVPDTLYHELVSVRTDAPHVFAAHVQQLRAFYAQSEMPWKTKMVGQQFNPVNLGDWFHERLVHWSKTLPKGRATTHVFRKTSLQYALSGESARVAADARLSEGVMLQHYAKVTDPQRREQSNRTFARIVASLDAEVANAYGHVPVETGVLEAQLVAATEAKNWGLAAQLTAELANRPPRQAG